MKISIRIHTNTYKLETTMIINTVTVIVILLKYTKYYSLAGQIVINLKIIENNHLNIRWNAKKSRNVRYQNCPDALCQGC